jgi:dTDP-4-amino-4,6-dideoxygalactose transaminase
MEIPPVVSDDTRKRGLSELAIANGMPTFPEPLHVGRPNIGERADFMRRVDEILDRRWLTNHGQCVRELEERLAEILGVKHCIPICNGTVALELAARALDLSGEVIVPSFTFIATAHALQWQGITPVFCDINPKTHNIDPAQVENLITPRTTGIVGVHLWGRPCDIDALEEIAKRHRLKLMFDAAHAFGCSHRGKLIGTFGACEVFSFHATKVFNTLEGGAIATNSDELAKKIRLMKNFGFTNYDEVDYIGTNGKMNEISAAMGLTGLKSLQEFVATNRRNYESYKRQLAGVPGIFLMEYDANDRPNYQYIVLEVSESETQIHRDLILQCLHAENVLARRYFYPGCHRMEPYRSYFPNARLLLRSTEEVGKRVLVLPTGSSVTEGDVKKICELIRLIVSNGERLTQWRLTTSFD